MSVPCRTCRLPADLRAEVVARHRRGRPLRKISAFLAEQGHTVSRNAVHRHVRRCVAPDDLLDTSDDRPDMLVATAAGVVMSGWPGLANNLAEELQAAGLTDAAAAVQSRLPEMMVRALEVAPEDASAASCPLVLEAHAVARASRAVLPGHPQA